jgi:hypothetical protein
MDQRIEQLFTEIHKLLEFLRQENIETKSSCQKGDMHTALRNIDASTDELNNLMRKWQDLHREITVRKQNS